MKTVGAIVAGGKASRFGADKGAALLKGRSLIDHVADGLRPQVDALVIVGRDWPDLTRIEDWPAPHLGPLGGLCGALRYAADLGFDTVMTAGCDVLPVWQYTPDHPLSWPHILDGHFLSGLWPASLAAALSEHILGQPNHSLRHWLEIAEARFVPADREYANLNTREDLVRYQSGQLDKF